MSPDLPYVEEISDRSALTALSDEWTALSERAQEASIFSSWEWMQAWLASFQKSRPLAVLLARSEGRLVGILPLLGGYRRWPWNRGGLGVAMNKQSPCGSLLCEGDPLLFLEAALEHVSRTRGPTSLSLPQLPVASPVVTALRVIGRDGRFRVRESASRCSSRIRIETSWEGYLATRSKHVQKEWRRKRRRLEEAGRVEMRIVSDPEALPRAMADVFEIERHGWKHESGSSFQTEEGLEQFYPRLASLCARRGWLRLGLLHLDGRPVAHCFAVAHGNELLALKTSFDQRLANLSPGLALMLFVSQEAFRERLGAVDLLGHPDRWKLEMANEQLLHVDLSVFPKGLLACEAFALLEDHARPFLRGQLPPPLAKAGRRILSSLRRDP